MVVPFSSKQAKANNLFENSKVLSKEFSWFAEVLSVRFASYFKQDNPNADKSIFDIPPPELDGQSIYGQIVQHYNMSVAERLVLLLTLAPHVCPQVLDPFFTQNSIYSRGFTEFGGVKGTQHGGFLPTAETAAFLIAGSDLTRRFQVLELFDPDHFFVRFKIIQLDFGKSNEPLLSGVLRLGTEYFFYFTTGTEYKPTFSAEFPAQRIFTKLDWEDLVLENYILEEVHEILKWIQNAQTIMERWGLKKLLKPGYRSLFYGPPGTGKTLTATLLGKSTGLDVYRVDLSKVVSKYIGETEKNLANIFDQAAYKNWILFFDEADALFGKRTSNNDAKDRYANQEVAYLLQRIEDFPGVIILASNLKSNIDEAFARRFQSMIYFPMPSVENRLLLWKKAFENTTLAEKVDLASVAEKYEMTGGAIINVLRYCALKAVERDPSEIYQYDIIEGIRKEVRKEGKTL